MERHAFIHRYDSCCPESVCIGMLHNHFYTQGKVSVSNHCDEGGNTYNILKQVNPTNVME